MGLSRGVVGLGGRQRRISKVLATMKLFKMRPRLSANDVRNRRFSCSVLASDSALTHALFVEVTDGAYILLSEPDIRACFAVLRVILQVAALFCDHILHIVLVCAQKQMIRPYTR